MNFENKNHFYDQIECYFIVCWHHDHATLDCFASSSFPFANLAIAGNARNENNAIRSNEEVEEKAKMISLFVIKAHQKESLPMNCS